jgi:hypothetical protein
MNLHNEFYSLREKTWNAFDEAVRKGTDQIGDFPIVLGEITLPAEGLRKITTIIGNCHEITIKGIVADPKYKQHPDKETEDDIIVDTTKIKVITYDDEIIEVEPDILNLQCLCTYLSGGFSVYSN